MLDDLARERLLRGARELGGEERVVDVPLALLGGERDELRLDLVEDAAHLGGLHLRLEVVEQDVVELVARLEARDIAAAELEVPLERGQERRVARGGLRLHPDRRRLRRGAGHLGRELRRDAHGLLVEPPPEANQARVVGVRVERLPHRLELVEEPADLGLDQPLVGELLEQTQMPAAGRGAGRGHCRPLVPREQHRQRFEAVNLLEPRLQPGERV